MSYDDDPLDSLVNDPVATVQKWTEKVVSGRVGDLERQVHENSVENARLRVQIAMDRDHELGGKWRQINNDTAFLAWLDEIDGLSGAPRLQLLQRAYNMGNPGPVSAIFKAFIASRIPPRERTATRLPHEQGGKRPTVRASAGAHEARGRIFAKGEIARFYDDCRRGVYDKRETERLQIEAERSSD
jgi:hypothetical protein